MKLTRKNSGRQKAILARIKAGLPVAGLITSMVALTGCEGSLQPVGIEPGRTVGKSPAEDIQPLAGDVPALAPRQLQQTVGEVPEPPPKVPTVPKTAQPNAKCEKTDAIQAVGIEPCKNTSKQ